jgi:hypothetical protein
MKILLLIFISFILISCQGAQEAFSLKKKTNNDEFLVEKKNPLVMPPNFDILPKPENHNNNKDINEENSIKDLLTSNQEKILQKENQRSEIEKLILDKIN